MPLICRRRSVMCLKSSNVTAKRLPTNSQLHLRFHRVRSASTLAPSVLLGWSRRTKITGIQADRQSGIERRRSPSPSSPRLPKAYLSSSSGTWKPKSQPSLAESSIVGGTKWSMSPSVGSQASPSPSRSPFSPNSSTNRAHLADFEAVAEGHFRINLHNCAIWAVANQYPQACASELDYLRDLIPEANVQRITHKTSGAHTCAYDIHLDADT